METPATSDKDSNLEETNIVPENKQVYPRFRSQFGLCLCMIGFFFVLIGLKPDLFGLSSGLSVGFAQLITFLAGLALLTAGASLSLMAFWPRRQRSLLAGFGLRVIATGYTIAAFTGLADAFGLGTMPYEDVYMGPLQLRGILIGIIIIFIGLIMLIRFNPYRTPKVKP